MVVFTGVRRLKTADLEMDNLPDELTHQLADVCPTSQTAEKIPQDLAVIPALWKLRFRDTTVNQSATTNSLDKFVNDGLRNETVDVK